MFKIGEFSKICLISTKTLRHWDELGLLKPAQVDRESSYRYYMIEQLYDVNRILALREMGLSLKQIRTMLSDNVSQEEIKGMFRLKQAELQDEIEQAESRLKMLEARLKHIGQDAVSLAEYDVRIREIPEQTVLAMRMSYPKMDEFAQYLVETYHAFDLQPNQHYLAVFHDKEYQNEQLDVKIAVTLTSPHEKIIAPDERGWALTTLPAVPMMATTIHRGNWVTLSDGYNALGRWIHQNNYQIAGAGREIFRWMDRTNPDEFVTELQFPVVRLTE